MDLRKGDTTYNLGQGRTAQCGDLLIVTDNAPYSYGPRKYYHRGEILKVTAVNGQTITFAGSHDDYKKAEKCEIFQIKPIQFELEKITILDPRPKKMNTRTGKMQHAAAGLKVDYCEHSKIKNVHVYDASHNASISVNNVYDFDIDACACFTAPPHNTRLKRVAENYCKWLPEDGYGIAIGDSQDVRVSNVQAYAWKHAITTGSGDSAMVAIVNRNISVRDSTFTGIYAELFWQNETSATALFKHAPANTHGNTEDSIFEHNTLNGSGFNIGGHNISFINNIINTNNYNEPMKIADRHWDAAFYFDETKSAQFKILNNHVYIHKFYQNPFKQNTASQPRTDKDFCYGEFVQFNFGDFLLGTELNPHHTERPPCKYTYELIGKVFKEGTLEIADNDVTVTGISGEDDPTGDFRTSMITVCGPVIYYNTQNYLNNHPNDANALKIKKTLQSEMQIDVKITHNSFIINNNPANSKMLLLFNPINGSAQYSWIRAIEISNNNHFEGFFRVSVNASDIFDGKLSDSVVVKDNDFFSSDITDQVMLFNTTANKDFPKTRANGSVVLNNTVKK